jgi:hypothetical protein
MVRLRAAELEIVDPLSTAGIAGYRAEAVRWALARISERPASHPDGRHERKFHSPWKVTGSGPAWPCR